MTPEQKAEFWRKHIETWRQSTLPQKTYCQQHDLTMASFGYWRTRLKRGTVENKKLIPVKLPSMPATINIYLPTGLRLEIPAHTLADILPVVHQTLQTH